MIPHVTYSHYFEAAVICPQDVITSCPQQPILLHLWPCLQVAEFFALPEVMEEVHQPKIHQQISNLPTARFLGLADVGVEVP